MSNKRSSYIQIKIFSKNEYYGAYEYDDIPFNLKLEMSGLFVMQGIN